MASYTYIRTPVPSSHPHHRLVSSLLNTDHSHFNGRSERYHHRMLIQILHSLEMMRDQLLQDFKIDPILIPSTAIKKLEPYTRGSGGLGDVWKCSMSAQSGTRHVSQFTNG